MLVLGGLREREAGERGDSGEKQIESTGGFPSKTKQPKEGTRSSEHQDIVVTNRSRMSPLSTFMKDAPCIFGREKYQNKNGPPIGYVCNFEVLGVFSFSRVI